ncbi:hypothetical protein ACLI4Z_17845 [Natrialbaceae archaeon A-arb3/5]
MERRDFIIGSAATVPIGIAGCLDDGSADGGPSEDDRTDDTGGADQEPDSSDEEETAAEDEADDETDASIDPDSMGELDPLAYELTVVSDATAESPLTIELELTNTDDRPYRYGERRAAMFWTVASDTSFSLYPSESVEETKADDDEVWWSSDPFAMTLDFQVETIEQGETHTEELVVLHTPVDDEDDLDELPAELEFRTDFAFVEDGRDDGVVDTDGLSWGFTLITDSDETDEDL